MKLLKLCILAVYLMVMACNSPDPEEQIKNLNGYWEIRNVETPYGKNIEYTISEQIDYIKVDDTVGFRVKVSPRFDGTYVSDYAFNNEAEKILIEIVNDSLRLIYSTLYDTWTETVLKADDRILKVKNEDGKIYTYERYEPLDLTE